MLIRGLNMFEPHMGLGFQVYPYIQSRFYRSPEATKWFFTQLLRQRGTQPACCQVLLGVPYTSAIDMWSWALGSAGVFGICRQQPRAVSSQVWVVFAPSCFWVCRCFRGTRSMTRPEKECGLIDLRISHLELLNLFATLCFQVCRMCEVNCSETYCIWWNFPLPHLTSSYTSHCLMHGSFGVAPRVVIWLLWSS